MRCDDSYTSLYKAHEKTFISIGEGKDKGSLKETIYKMDDLEKNLLKNFLEVRNQGLLFNKSNVDKNLFTINSFNCWKANGYIPMPISSQAHRCQAL